MKQFLDPKEASNWLMDGKILIHPTEGIWGIGCDAFSAKAVKKIKNLKQRDSTKSFILLVSSTSNALAYCKPLSQLKLATLQEIWPGHTTAILESSKIIPDNIKSIDNTIALRVSAHKPLFDLLKFFNKPMVSTSANISNQPTPKSLAEVSTIFKDPDVAIYNHKNGIAKKPSSIINLNTMEYLRE